MADNYGVKDASGATISKASVDDGAGNHQDITRIVRLQPGSTATDLGKAVGAAHNGGDVGAPALAVRNDASADLAGADGDYAPLSVDDESRLWTRIGKSSGQVAKDTASGSNDIGNIQMCIRKDAPGTLTPADSDYATPLLSSRGAQYSAPLPESLNGVSAHRILSAASTNATNIKSSPGKIYTIWIRHLLAADQTRFLKIYDKATSPTVGTDVPILTIPITNSAQPIYVGDFGHAFSAGISYAITSLIADSDTTAVGLNEIVGAIWYF